MQLLSFIRPSVARRSSVSLLLLALSMATLTRAQDRSASLSVDAAKVENKINPGLYGQFVEIMFGGVNGVLWDELIRNRGFEEPPNEIGLSRDWQREPDDRNHDPAVQLAWDASASSPFSHDARAEGHSMRIDIHPDQWNSSQRHGISQGGIPLRKGVPYHGYLWLKGLNYNGFVTVALEQDRTEGKTYAATEVTPSGSNWAKYEFTLTPNETDPLAKFSILIHGVGRIWIDQASLMPGDATAGSPAPVYERIEALRPAFIRWPGGNVAQDYHWMRGVGPRDQRPTWVNAAWWNEIESSDFGTDEYLALCKALHTEPSITVNVNGDGATPAEAAAWVEYVNGPATSKYGHMRALNGHAEPYGVKLWEVGNEVFGEWEIGHTDATTYAHNFNVYAAAMKAVDPGIHLIAVGHELPWNRTLLQIAGANIDEIAIHFYYGRKEMGNDWGNLYAHPLTFDSFYEKMSAMVQELAPHRHVELNVNEWNTSLPVPSQHTMRSALYAGAIMNGFERNGSIVGASAVSDLANGWSGGIIQASREDTFVTPTYLVNKLYNEHLGAARLGTKVQGPTFNTAAQGDKIPVLDAIATRSADGSEIFIKAVNKDVVNGLQVEVHLDHATVAPTAELESITAASPDVANTFMHPDAVSVRSSSVSTSGDHFSVEIPSDSVSVLTLHVVSGR